MVTRSDRCRVAALAVMLANTWSGVSRAAEPASAPAALFAIAGADRVLLRRAAADQASAVYTLAISPAPGVDLRAWSPTVIATVRDGSVQTASEGAVKPQLLPGDAAHPASLQLTVEFAKLYGPGTYEVTIGFFARPASPPGGAVGGSSAPARAGTAPEPPAAVVVKLVLPAAQLRAPSAVHIDRFLPLFGEPVDAPAAITLFETGKEAPIGLSIRREGELTSSDHPTGVEIELTDGSATGASRLPRSIAAGESGPVGIRVTGDAPVGTTRGNLLISAPELAAPVVLPIEIRAHRSTAWIPLAFVAGAVLGLFWRYASQHRKQQLEKQARRQDVLDQVAELERGYPTTWRTDLTELLAARDKCVRWSDPPDEALTCAEQALTAAIATRAGKRTTLLSRIAEAREATLPSRSLPAGLDLLPLTRGFQAAYDHAIAGDLIVAIDLATDVSQRLSVLVATAQAWAREFRAVLDPLGDGVPGCPREAQGAVHAAIAKAIDSAGKLEGVSQADILASDAPVRPRLDALQTARLDADAVASVLVEGLEAADAAIAEVDAAIPDAARQRMHDATRVAAMPGRPERTIAAAVIACGRLATAVGAALDALSPGTRPPELAALLAAGDYTAALAWRASSRAPGTPTSFRTDAFEKALPVAVARRMSFELEPPAPEPVLPRFVPADPPPRTAAAIRRELAWWVRLAWLISALVASIAAWAVYGGSFVGTRVELFGLFATGFATDLATGSRLEELIGRIRAPGGGTGVG